jgi:hypothetical protein
MRHPDIVEICEKNHIVLEVSRCYPHILNPIR